VLQRISMRSVFFSPRSRRRFTGSAALVVLWSVAILAVVTTLQVALFSSPTAPDANRDGDAEHGRYLVQQVGMCADCHTPRDENGAFVREKWLQGAALRFAPKGDMPAAPVSKPIAGLPGLTDDQALEFLTKGTLPGGRRPLPPMPGYRFSVDDAKDVIAYLRNPTPPPTSAH